MSLWNSTFKSAGKPLQRKTRMQAAQPIQRSAWNRTAPKKRAGHNKAYLAACRGELCFIRIAGICIGGMDTTVPCHANWSEYGKGMGLKAKDIYTVPGCMACHYWLDQGPAPKQEKRQAWESAYERWEPARAKKLDAKPAAKTAGNKKPALARGSI